VAPSSPREGQQSASNGAFRPARVRVDPPPLAHGAQANRFHRPATVGTHVDHRRAPQSPANSPVVGCRREQERDFRQSRRRGFDDDNYEPPTRNFGYPPPRGPQFESPSGPPVRATVKWYNPDTGFGFVELADGSGDAFLHVSVVERRGVKIPPFGTSTCT
jgi:hypothetical protein